MIVKYAAESRILNWNASAVLTRMIFQPFHSRSLVFADVCFQQRTFWCVIVRLDHNGKIGFFESLRRA